MKKYAYIAVSVCALAAGCSGGGTANTGAMGSPGSGSDPGGAPTSGTTPPGTAANKPPHAAFDAALTAPDTEIFIDVLGNDTDSDGDVLQIGIVSPPAHGSVSVNDSGSPTDPTDDFVVYTPAAGFLGADSFEYSVNDGEATSVAEVNLLVTAARSMATPGAAVCGSVVKARVSGAVVSLYAVDADGQASNGAPLAQAVTDAQGNWCTTVTGSSQAYLVSAAGGSFFDESDANPNPADRRQVELAPHEVLQALLPPNETYAAVTIYSNAVLERAKDRTFAGDFLAQFDDSRLRLTLALGFDPIATAPADPILPDPGAREDSRRYAMALGGAANAMNNIAVGFGQTGYGHALIEALGRDLSDCDLNGLATASQLTVQVNGAPRELPGFLDLNTEILRFRNNRSTEYADTPLAQFVASACVLPTGVDITPPMITGMPDNLMVAAAGAAGTVATDPAIAAFLGAPRAVDSHDGALPVTNNAPATFAIGSTTVDFVAIDSQANSTNVSATILVADLEGPTVVAPADRVAEQSGVMTAVAIGTAAASDNVTAASSLSITNNAPAAGFPVGTTIVTWAATDAVGNTGVATQRITVSPVGNNLPEVVADSLSVAEGATASLLDGGAASVLDNDSDADGDTLTAALLTPPSNGVVAINPDGRFSYMHDGSETTDDSFTYVANDGSVDSAPAAVLVTITPVNDAPVFTSVPAITATEEDLYSYAVAATDADGDVMTLSAIVSPTWLTFSDNGDGTALFEGTPANAAVGNHPVTLAVSDGVAAAVTQSFSINVANTNDAPTAVVVTPNLIQENLPAGTTVGTLSTSDIDAGDVHTYTLVAGTGDSGNASFAIVGDQLQSASSFDFETQANYSVRIRVSDGNGGAHVEVLTISIGDTSDGAMAISLNPGTVAENLGAGQPVGTLATVGAGGARTYTLVAGTGDSGNAAFSVSGDQLLSAQGFDFEMQSAYSVRVQSDDGNGDVLAQVLSVSVKDSNDAPGFTSSPANTGAQGMSYIYTALAADQDADLLGFSATTLPAWLVFVDNGDGTADLTGVPGNADVGVHPVVIEVTDGTAAPQQQNFSITVADVNDAPAFTSVPATSAIENSAYAYAVATDDIDGDATTITAPTLPAWLVFADNGNGTASLTGTPATGDLGVHAVVIQVSDGIAAPVQQGFSITVAVVNVAPGFTSTPATSTNEDAGYNYAITTDDSNGDAVIITAPTLPAWLGFADSGDGTATLNGTSTNDDVGTHPVVLEVSDGTAAPVQQGFTITVVNTNDAPTALNLDNSTIVEQVGTVVGSLSTTDIDVGDTHSYSLVAGAGDTGNAAFTIAGNQLRPAVEMDFEVQSAYSVRVRADDGNTGTFDAVFAITVIDGNDPPTAIGISNLTIDENLPANSLVATLTTVDPNPDTHTYSLVGGSGSSDNGDFVIVDDQLRTSKPLDFETDATRNIRLRSSDGFLAVDDTFTITLNNLNDQPVVASTAPLYAVAGLPIRYEFVAADEDAADTLTVTAPTLPSWLTLTDRGNGAATLTGTAALIDAGSHPVTLQVDDDGSPPLNAVQNFAMLVVESGVDSDLDGVPDDVEALTGGRVGPMATNVINVSAGTTNAAIGAIPAGGSALDPTYVLYQANVPVASSNNWNLNLGGSCDNIVFWGSLSGMSTTLSAGGAPTTEFEVNNLDVATIDQCDNVQFHNIGFAGGTDSGLILKKGQIELNNVRIYGNTASEGGGIFADDTDLTINNSVIAENIASSSGGGLFIKGGNSRTSIRNTIISGNFTWFDGGGFYLEDVTANTEIVNNLIVANGAFSFGGAFYFKGNNSLIANNTVAYNETNQGPGLYYDSGGGPILSDNIFYFNRRRNGSTDTFAGGVNSSMSMYNLIEGSPVGTGDIDIAATGPDWQSGYYLSQATSAAVDSGSTLAWLVGLDDQYTDGTPGAPVTDSGAFPGPGQLDRGYHYPTPTDGPADAYIEVDDAPNTVAVSNGGAVPLLITPTRLGANLGRGHRLIATLPGPNANLASFVTSSYVDPLGDGESAVMSDMGDGTYYVLLVADGGVGAPTAVQLRIQIDGANMPQLFDITRNP